MYEIENLNQFAKMIGLEVAKDAGFKKSDLKKYISVKNIKGIVKEHASKKRGSNKLWLTKTQAEVICEDIFEWLAGFELAKQAADDKLDCWWDDEKDRMIFKRKEIKDDLA